MLSLTPLEARIIGVMLEKEITTPDQYPLSLNGLTTGCNQKSNREPVMSLTEAEVQDAVVSLKAKRVMTEQSGFGSRVVKYKHRFCNTEFGDLQLSEQQLALICVLLLRGPQTPGELRTRTQRLAEFASVDEVEQVLQSLYEHNGDCLVVKLEREPGKRESRYQQCFAPTDTNVQEIATEQGETQHVTSDAEARIQQLEETVARLVEQVDELQQQLNELLE
ncbi:YceH family protein [Aestuariibacter salexigens]|uniref:YceH family protein n=1 Tax=Aestuariibacter salexigens TaxID=226010 RepID=UPI000429B319|nr:YceH family protein [Aestuariibacter salexigens]